MTVTGPTAISSGGGAGGTGCSDSTRFYANYNTTTQTSGYYGVRYVVTASSGSYVKTIAVSPKYTTAVDGYALYDYPGCNAGSAYAFSGTLTADGSSGNEKNVMIRIVGAQSGYEYASNYKTLDSVSIPDSISAKTVYGNTHGDSSYYVEITAPAGHHDKSSQPYVSITYPYLDVTATYYTPTYDIVLELSEDSAKSTTISGTTIKYFDLSSATTITGKYKITSDYALTSSSISLNGTSKLSSLVRGTETTYELSSLSPTYWDTTNIISLSAENAEKSASTTDSDHTYRFYGGPVNKNNKSGLIYKLNKSKSYNYFPFTAYCPLSSNLSVSSTIGSVSLNSYSTSTGTVAVKYTPDVSECGSFESTITVKDTFINSTGKTATSTFSYSVYNPPTVSFTANKSTPSYGETLTFTNTSTESSGSSCLYSWYVDDSLEKDSVSKSTTFTYTFSDYDTHVIKLVGWDDTYSSDTTTTSSSYSVPTYLNEISFNTIGTVYASLPITISLTDVCYQSDVTYTWSLNGTQKQSGAYKSYTYTPTTVGSDSIKVVSTYQGESKNKSITYTVNSPAPTISFKCYADAAGTTEITSETYIADSSTKVYLQNNSTPVSSTSPTYKWYFNGSEITPQSTLENDLQYFIPSVSSTGQFPLTLEGTVSSYTSTGSMNLTIVSPAPVISIVTSADTAKYGDIINCSLDITETTIGVTYSYIWTLDGVTVSTTDTMSFTVDATNGKTYSITARAYVVGSKTTWYSNTATASVSTIEYKDPLTRFSILITDGEKYMLCTRHNLSDCRYNSLQFEKRLNETGSGSFNLLVNSSDDSDVLSSGSDIIIYDNSKAIYFGVITSVDNNDINPYNVTLSKKYYSIEFSEGCRKLSYLTSPNNSIYTAPYSSTSNKTDNLLYYITGDTNYIGSVDNFTNNYTFSVSNQDILSQVDSLSEQCGARYRTNINTYCYFSDVSYYSKTYIYKNGGWGIEIPVGAIVFSKNDNCIVVSVVRNKYSSTSYGFLEITEMCKYGSVTTGDNLTTSVILNNPIIDFKQTYYQESSVFPYDSDVESTNKNALYVNKTTYDVDDIDSLNKHYGSISCTSPQNGVPNITIKAPLLSYAREDNSLYECGYINDSNDCYIVSAELNSDNNYVDIIISKSISSSIISNYIYYPIKLLNEDNWTYYSILTGGTITENYSYIVNGITYSGTKITKGIQLSTSGWTTENYRELIGLHLFCNKINIVPSGYGQQSFNTSTGEIIYIGGIPYTVSSIITQPSTSSGTWVITVNIPYDEYPYICSIVDGSLVYSSNITNPSSPPYNLYPNKTLSVVLQSNLDSSQVTLLWSNLARYGSNYTQDVTGTCSIKNFVKADSTLPDVGDHVALYYNDGSVKPKYSIIDVPDVGKEYNYSDGDYDEYYHDYELQSFTVNTQTMTVDFNMGMKPLNIGDVIYRISQNMTTNITTN